MDDREQQTEFNKLSSEVISKYRGIGFQCANVSKASPGIIANGLNKVLAVFRDDSKSMTQRRIEKLRADIAMLNEQKVDYVAGLRNEQLKVEAKEKEIKSLKESRDEIRNKKRDTAELINVGLQIFGIIVLSLEEV